MVLRAEAAFFLAHAVKRDKLTHIVDVPSLLCHVGMAMDSEKSTSHSWASGTTFPQHAQTRCGASATIASAIAPPEQHRSARERPKPDSQMLRRTQKRTTSIPQKNGTCRAQSA